ncbi:hypothetical protein CANCADRAFT_58098 [Tortispora caseinolytica NRRL Y-17796]|uniref:Uncharacterized protein n=1 Tax=Tortispora caseinolytica NRRL Y-17796 TaxID=767744 RepID=A0A1E4TBD4_9ASCO|nr:hypothetical protein CANCADRAFT_58098 [Tortispora caseinolytica NRRL Y-17796]
MYFRMSVPVLSEHMTLTEPKVSTLGSLRIIAFLEDMRSTPRAKVTVTMIGKPSGIAATANDTPIIIERSLPSLSIETCRGVLGFSMSDIILKILPNSVYLPTPITIPWP